MTQEHGLDRTKVLLSMQRALWGAVTADLRAVSVGWSKGQVEATFVYDCPINDELTELVGIVETEVLADFPSGVSTRFDVVHMPTPQDRSEASREWWAYLRLER